MNTAGNPAERFATGSVASANAGESDGTPTERDTGTGAASEPPYASETTTLPSSATSGPIACTIDVPPANTVDTDPQSGRARHARNAASEVSTSYLVSPLSTSIGQPRSPPCARRSSR